MDIPLKVSVSPTKFSSNHASPLHPSRHKSANPQSPHPKGKSPFKHQTPSPNPNQSLTPEKSNLNLECGLKPLSQPQHELTNDGEIIDHYFYYVDEESSQKPFIFSLFETDIQILYTGELLKGQKHGFGTALHLSTHQTFYTGEWLYDIPYQKKLKFYHSDGLTPIFTGKCFLDIDLCYGHIYYPSGLLQYEGLLKNFQPDGNL